jgi:hypothetical protein
VDSFKVYVQSENIFLQSQAYRYYLRPFLPSAVQAATLKSTPAPKVTATPEAKPAIVGLSTPSSWSKEFTSWVAEAQLNGLYPYCEYNGQVDPTCNEASDVLLSDYATYANVCQQSVSCYISPSAVTRISTKIDPILIQSLARGEPVAYAAVASLLETTLPVAPQYRNLTNQLSDTTVDPLNSQEQALLDKRDGKTPATTPYVEITNSTPLLN